MILEELLKISPFSLPQEKKEMVLLAQLNQLTQLHRDNSSDYAKILEVFHNGKIDFSKIEDIPHIPVTLFKMRTMRSISENEIFKTLTSSGTTSNQPSRIYLDRTTAHNQVTALAAIMTALLGKNRLPMLIVDSQNVIKDRNNFSARGAAILGMLNFGRNPTYVLNENMEIDRTILTTWLNKYQNEPVLIFGMTFMLWKYFINQLEDHEINLPNGVLIHSGGWKKLQEEAVNNEIFKSRLEQTTGISRCHSFYGMVEQVGSINIECEHGYLHSPVFADIIMRNPKTWQESALGESGVVQVLSALPSSYPGHSLLTEDLGTVVGIDNCPCGRKGKHFLIHGRIPKAELRGCGDTHAFSL